MARSKSQRGEKPVRKMHPNSLKNLQPFKTGDDPRRNVGGVPQDQKELNALLDEIFAEEISDDKGNKMQKLRVALNRLLLSKNPSGPIHVLDRRFGKVREQIDLTNSDGSLVSKLSDEERLARMKQLAAAIAEEIEK